MRKLIFLILCIPFLLAGGVNEVTSPAEINGVAVPDTVNGVSGVQEGGADGSVGYSVPAGSSSFSGDNIFSTLYTATAGTVRYAHLKVYDGNSASVCISLKDSSGNNIISATTTLSDGTEEWANIDLGSDVTLTTTTYYCSVRPANTVTLGYWLGPNNIIVESAVCSANINTGAAQYSVADLVIIFNNTSGNP